MDAPSEVLPIHRDYVAAVATAASQIGLSVAAAEARDRRRWVRLYDAGIVKPEIRDRINRARARLEQAGFNPGRAFPYFRLGMGYGR